MVSDSLPITPKAIHGFVSSMGIKTLVGLKAELKLSSDSKPWRLKRDMERLKDKDVLKGMRLGGFCLRRALLEVKA